MKQPRRGSLILFSTIQDDETASRDLVSRFLKNRDESSFRLLYGAHTPSLFLLALRLLSGVRHDAEDAIQETWIRAVQQLGEFRWQSRLRTWLCGITINCCREIIRRRAQSTHLDTEYSRDVVSRSIDLEGEVELLVRELPDGYREVLVLHDIEGYTHEEIASRLDIAIGTSKSQLSRARKTLRARLDAPNVNRGGKNERSPR